MEEIDFPAIFFCYHCGASHLSLSDYPSVTMNSFTKLLVSDLTLIIGLFSYIGYCIGQSFEIYCALKLLHETESRIFFPPVISFANTLFFRSRWQTNLRKLLFVSWEKKSMVLYKSKTVFKHFFDKKRILENRFRKTFS